MEGSELKLYRYTCPECSLSFVDEEVNDWHCARCETPLCNQETIIDAAESS